MKQNSCKNLIGLSLTCSLSRDSNCYRFTKLAVLQLTSGVFTFRERAAEVEKEIERQRMLELEHVKTKELRHNLDMEKERQTQVRSLLPVSQFIDII